MQNNYTKITFEGKATITAQQPTPPNTALVPSREHAQATKSNKSRALPKKNLHTANNPRTAKKNYSLPKNIPNRPKLKQSHTTPNPSLPSFDPYNTHLDLLHNNQTQHHSPIARQHLPSKVIPRRPIGEDKTALGSPLAEPPLQYLLPYHNSSTKILEIQDTQPQTKTEHHNEPEHTNNTNRTLLEDRRRNCWEGTDRSQQYENTSE
ncbi:hypothetical protein ACOSQ4_028735 [Xanthoceras sorbifolium]